MKRYLEIKPGSLSETALRLRDDYQALFKAELEKTGKGLAQMTDSEKKAFFNKIDKMHNAKSEMMSKMPVKKDDDKTKTTMVVKPGKENVIRIPKEKLPDYLKKGYIEAESFVPEAKQVDELTAGQKKLPLALQKAIKAKEKNEDIASMNPNLSPQARDYTAREKDVKDKKGYLSNVDLFLKKMKDPKFAAAFRLSQKTGQPFLYKENTNEEVEKKEAVDNPYAIGMAAAMKATGDTPPLKKSTIVKAHKIADKVKKEEVKLEAVNLRLLKPGSYITVKSKEYVVDKFDGEIVKASDEDGDFKYFKIKDIDKIEDPGFVSIAAEFKPEDGVNLDLLDEMTFTSYAKEQMSLKNAKDKRNELKNRYNAIMAGQLDGDEGVVEDQIRKLDMSIKKQEEELINKMKMMKKEAVDPERISNLQQRIQKMSVDMNKLDMADPKSKTKAAIYKSDINTAQLRLKDLIQRKTSELNKEVKETKMNYKSFRHSLKKEQDKKDSKKTMTGQPMTKVDVDPKITQM